MKYHKFSHAMLKEINYLYIWIQSNLKFQGFLEYSKRTLCFIRYLTNSPLSIWRGVILRTLICYQFWDKAINNLYLSIQGNLKFQYLREYLKEVSVYIRYLANLLLHIWQGIDIKYLDISYIFRYHTYWNQVFTHFELRYTVHQHFNFP